MKVQREEEQVPLKEHMDTRISALYDTINQERQAGIERALATRAQSELVASAIEQRFQDIKESTALAASAVEKRLEGMNEFRAQLNTQASFFVTRSEIEDKVAAGRVLQDTFEKRVQTIEQNKLNVSAHDALEQRMQKVEQAHANIEGRIWAIGVGFTVLTTIISLGLHFIH